MSTIIKWKIFCNTEQAFVEGLLDETAGTPTTCFNNNTHTINQNSQYPIETITSTMPINKNRELQASVGDKNLFGELKSSLYTPIIQNYALYGILNNQIYESLIATSGSIIASDDGTESLLNISDDLYSYAVLRSKKVLKYRPGYSNICRLNAVFDVGVTNCLQFTGLGNNGSDLYFCYNGTEFGVRLSTGGKSDVHVLTLSEGEGSSGSTATITLNDVVYNVPLTDTSKTIIKSVDVNFTACEIACHDYTGWNTESIGNTIIFQARDVGIKNGTFSFSCNKDTAGSFSQKMVGQNLSTTFVSKDNWNGSSDMITNLNPLMRNMYAIEYSWYGSSNILFKIYNPDTSRYELVHEMKFANLQVNPSLSQPNMYIQSGLASLGSTVSKSIKIAGSFAATDGKIKINTPIYGVTSKKSIPKNTETVLLALKNRNTINGFSNQSEMLITRFSFTTNGNKPVKLQIIKNPTKLSDDKIDDYISWKYVNQNNSLSLYNTSSKTYTGGEIINTYQLPKQDNIHIDLSAQELFLYQRDIILFIVESEGITEVDVAVTIIEDL